MSILYRLSIITILMLTIIFYTNTFYNFKTQENDFLSFPENADSYAENIIIKKYSALGLPEITIKTSSLLHYLNNDKSYILNPLITLHSKGKAPWIISSQKGEALNGIEQLTFIGSVILNQKENNLETIIQTNQLIYFTKTNKAYTNEFITLTRANYSVSSTGLKADLNTNQFTLLNQPQGIYNKT